MRFVLDSLLSTAEARPDSVAVNMVTRRGREDRRTWSEIALAAGRAAGYLKARGLRSGEVVVLIGTHHIDLYAVWLGCVWLGAIPTILAEPSVRVDRSIYWSRLGELMKRSGAWGILADPKVRAEEITSFGLRHERYDEVSAGCDPVPGIHRPAPEDILLLQHSSGTTGLQKGVRLSHAAVASHAERYNERLALTSSDTIASWLPLYHDMGFIACFVNPMLCGARVCWLSPFEWIANPSLLMDAVTLHQATLTWLPNFAFAFLAQRVKPEPGRYRLHSLRAVINCSEPVSAGAMRVFADRFKTDGLNVAALQTCYAMAENVFAVTTTWPENPPRQRWINADLWRDQHRAQYVPLETPRARLHVSSGSPVPGCDVRILDEGGMTVATGQAGTIAIRSPFLFSGYFGREDLQGALFDKDGFYNTGDLGYLDEEGHLFVTGRQKDLIIVGGRNIYPQDVEQVVSEVPGVYPGRIVCFGVQLSQLATEGLVILCESSEPADRWNEISTAVRTIVPSRLDIDVFDTRVVAQGLLRKSTAGKLARSGNREWYLAGRFGAVAEDILPNED